ncbi:MAG TPA: hypothetical protein VL860_15380, partial [Planctomycetota bacterium]|nr:hypothetical protein [Planctomycetota bacterium]
MSGLNRWASAALVTVGAGCLVGAYTLFSTGTPAVAETRLITPITVVATPAAAVGTPVRTAARAAARKPVSGPAGFRAQARDIGAAQPQIVLHDPLQDLLQSTNEAPNADLEAGADDADGVEPASLTGSHVRVPLESPEAAWMRRLVVARELLREGAVESGRQTLERII